MTREVFERRKQKLEEELQSGIELLQAAHRVQMRALEMVWMLAAEEAGEVSRPVPAPREPREPERASTRDQSKGLAEVEEDLRAVREQLPDVFDRSDVVQALGYEPDRRMLYKLLQGMLRAGELVLEVRGLGRTPSRYRKA
jgi:hypothetical protein